MVQINEENTAKPEARCTMTYFAREYLWCETERLLCCAKLSFHLHLFETEGNGRLYGETERNGRIRTGPNLNRDSFSSLIFTKFVIFPPTTILFIILCRI